jgi:hypothetical protein
MTPPIDGLADREPLELDDLPHTLRRNPEAEPGTVAECVCRFGVDPARRDAVRPRKRLELKARLRRGEWPRMRDLPVGPEPVDVRMVQVEDRIIGRCRHRTHVSAGAAVDAAVHAVI